MGAFSFVRCSYTKLGIMCLNEKMLGVLAGRDLQIGKASWGNG